MEILLLKLYKMYIQITNGKFGDSLKFQKVFGKTFKTRGIFSIGYLPKRFFVFKMWTTGVSIKAQDVEERGGKELLKLYGRSLIKALQKAYPENHFQPWKFCQVPKGYWEDPSNASEYVKWLSHQLNITKKEDWNLVTNQQINSLRGSTFIQKYGGLSNTFLSKFLPQLAPFSESSPSFHP